MAKIEFELYGLVERHIRVVESSEEKYEDLSNRKAFEKLAAEYLMKVFTIDDLTNSTGFVCHVTNRLGEFSIYNFWAVYESVMLLRKGSFEDLEKKYA